ncbi:MAG: hypothetical protein KC646_13360 [Candidatus Cloacimonetes bacterium]|nr:hypothetical protein [Candidatus Cloacimonadota bacterium]
MKKVLSIIVIFICVFILIWSEHPQLILSNKMAFGDLQSISGLSKFKQKEPQILSQSFYNKEATILCFGDSLLITNYGYNSFSLQLQNRLKTPVSTHVSLHDQSLKAIQHQLTLHPKVKVIVLESIEKYMYGKFPSKLQLSLFQIDSLFTKREAKLQSLLLQSVIAQWAQTKLNDFKWSTFGDFPNELLHYKQDRLYLKQSLSTQFVGSSFSPIQSTVHQRYIQKLTSIQKYLDSVGVKLFVLIVPNKATIEKPIHNLINYQHITFVQNQLKKLNVDCIDVYSAFQNKKNLYFKTDSHWNKNGVKLAIEQTYKKLSQFSK